MSSRELVKLGNEMPCEPLKKQKMGQIGMCGEVERGPEYIEWRKES